ncbi:cysteine proteinase [Aureobasidium subglaciale]|nr:cysteine proteinase [Aureobasidium subglaciale]
MGGSQEEFPLLNSLGLYAANILGDGNCLFHALSDQLYGHQKEHQVIRSRVIGYMREHADYYKQFIDAQPGGGTRRNPKRKNVGSFSAVAAAPSEADIDHTFQNHLERMAKGGTYGDNMEISAFSSAYNVDVKIYQRDFAYMISGSGDDGERDVAHIAYHVGLEHWPAWEHYSSIRNLDGPHHGPPKVTVKALSPDEEQKQKEKLAQTPHVLPWMVDVVLSSLPFLADKPTIKRTLEECKGNIDAAVDKLMGAEENGSLSSAQESSSVEREPDSDEEYPGKDGPNKKRDRRPSSRQQSQEANADEMRAKFETHNGSQESIISEASESMKSLPDKKDGAKSFDTRPRPTIRLKFNAQKATSPAPVPAKAPQRQPARDKKDIKKQAQKAARKEREQAATSKDRPESPSTSGMKLRSKGMVNTPPIESGFRTLFI